MLSLDSFSAGVLPEIASLADFLISVTGKEPKKRAKDKQSWHGRV
jgi:hypothetical protein